MYRHAFAIFLFLLCVFELVNSDVLVDKYLGCYRNFSNHSMGSQTSIDQSMTIDLCIKTCRSNNSTFAGLKKGNQCFCGEDFKELISENNCTKECSGDNSQCCGGTNEQSISVYSVCSIGYFGIGCDKVCHCNQQAPCQRMTGKCPTGCDSSWIGQACDTANASPTKLEWYVGCYRDGNPPAWNLSLQFAIERENNPTNACLNLCARNNYTYMGTQYYRDCNCGESNIYSKYGSSSGCTFPCTGNNSQICGGDLVNSVYSVCPTGSFSLNCLSRCNCFNDSRCIYIDGTCTAGCEPGWTGNSCSLRDCNVASGSCNGPSELCETIDLKYATKTRCGCKEGYIRDKPWENCMDVNECLDLVSSCGTIAYNCTNTIGSFVCSFCPEGQIIKNGSCFYLPTNTPKTAGSTGSADSCSPTRGELIGAVIGAGIGMFILGVVVGIMLNGCRRKSCIGMERNESKNVDATHITSNSKPRDSTALEDYQTLDKDMKDVEEPYAQLKDSIN